MISEVFKQTWPKATCFSKRYRDQILFILCLRKLGVSKSSTVNITWLMSLGVLGFDLKSIVILNDTREKKVNLLNSAVNFVLCTLYIT